MIEVYPNLFVGSQADEATIRVARRHAMSRLKKCNNLRR
jgi:hypothetical protein